MEKVAPWEDYLVKVIKVPKESFLPLHESAHMAIFGEFPESNFHYAVMAVDDKDNPTHYFTINEVSNDTAYVCYGGALPDFRGKGKSFLVMAQMVDQLLDRYNSVRWSCKNDNPAMIKFGVEYGFKIIGISHLDGAVYIEHEVRRDLCGN